MFTVNITCTHVGATGLQNLIVLSMFEEDVVTMDRIERLHTVGSTIAPLVYDLKTDSSFDEFIMACKIVWKLVEHKVTELSTDLVSYNDMIYSMH